MKRIPGLDGFLHDVRHYLDELYTNGKVDSHPQLGDFRTLPPTYLLQKQKKYSIAVQFEELPREKVQYNDGQFILREGDKSSPRQLTLYYFPNKIEHAELFAQSHVLPGGPQDTAPGAVAALDITHLNCIGYVGAEYLQYCFYQGSPNELTRGIVNKYMGARTRLLETFFSLDIVQNANSMQLGHLLMGGNNQSTLDAVLEKAKIKEKFEQINYSFVRKD